MFFANSGAEANEAAIKLSRRTGRSKIVACEGAFHGRTTGALALTHKAAYREPFEPLLPDVVHVPFG
ncbi:aminotransferase class III-fold pyridoxal phosphate-dependent enzyme, partial [Alicyclobacillus suci]|uniref:aminotransferase class III-fold pyridoxal phosphate-dependent enzyme n=1 Tax=Alicyclobacillus suci TaxID=2816080 RepID=UPI002E283001